MDTTVRMTMRIAVAAVVLVLLLPASAFAKDTLSHTTTTTRVSGAQIAEQMLGQVTRVQLGSNGATLSVTVDGKLQPLVVDYSALAGASGTSTAGGGDIGGLVRLFAIPIVGGAVLKIASMLTRLGRG
jgi:hypothetical protein